MSDDLNLNDVFDIISGWSVEEIQNLMYHMNWSRAGGIAPFKGPENTSNPDTKKEEFDNYRVPIKSLFDTDADNEVKAKWVICATFLFMDDDEARKRISEIFDDDVVQYAVELLKQMDATVSEGGREISKLQLFYTLHKQRESLEANDDGSIKTKKVTWSDVTSPCGPKIVQSDEEHYHYVYEDMDDFDGFQERYNIAAKLGERHQYRSNFLKYEIDDVYGVKIIKVLATKDCSTFDQVVIDEKLKLLMENREELEKVMKAIAKEYFRQVHYNFDLIPEMTRDEFEHVLPRLKDIVDDCYQKTMDKWNKWQPLRTKVTYEDVDYHVVHGDEWPGNFLTSEDLQDAYFMDFEDAIFAEAKKGVSIVQSVGGDLASRIVSIKKTNDPDFTPAALNIFGSIGRLIAAIVQFGSIQGRVGAKNIGTFLNLTLDEFKEALKKKNPALVEDSWEQYQTQILLHAWDWALYWIEKDRFRDPYAKKFIDEIKKILGCSEAPAVRLSGDENPPSPSESVFEYPEVGVGEAKKLFDEAFKLQKKRKNDDAYDTCSEAYSIVESSGNSTEKAFLSLWLGQIASWTKKSKGITLSWLNKTVHVFEEQPNQVIVNLSPRDENILLECYDYMVWLYWTMGEEYYDDAEEALRRWYALYWGEEDYADTLSLEQILEQPTDVIKGDIEFHFDSIWGNAAQLYYSKGEYSHATKIYEELAKQESEDAKADGWRMCAGIAYSMQGDYEKAEAIQQQCWIDRRRIYEQDPERDGRLVSKALRNLGQNAAAAKEHEKARDYYGQCLQVIEETSEQVVSNEEKKEWIGFIRELIEELSINSTPMLVDSQYNIFSGHDFIPDRKAEISDKAFQNILRTFVNFEKKGGGFALNYCASWLSNVDIESQNQELQYFLLLYLIYHTPHEDIKHRYQRLLSLSEELARDSGDDLYLYVSQVCLFRTCSHYMDVGDLFEKLLYIPQRYNKLFVTSRVLMMWYKIWQGEHFDSMGFGEDARKLLPEDNSSFATHWTIDVARAISCFRLSKEDEANELLNELQRKLNFIQTLNFQDIDTYFTEVMQLWFVLDTIGDFRAQKSLLELFNQQELKYELGENSLARLEMCNGIALMRENNAIDEAIEKYRFAEDLALDPIIKSQALCLLGEAYMDKSDFSEAIKFYEKAINLDKHELDYHRVYRNLGICYLRLPAPNVRKARDYYSKCVKVNNELWVKTASVDYLEQEIEAQFELANWLRTTKPAGEPFFIDAIYDKHLRGLLKYGISALRDVRKDVSVDTSGLGRILLVICEEGKKIDTSSFYSSQERMVSYLSRNQ
jgi:tetratricopeptide (TPR) repeat protein